MPSSESIDTNTEPLTIHDGSRWIDAFNGATKRVPRWLWITLTACWIALGVYGRHYHQKGHYDLPEIAYGLWVVPFIIIGTIFAVGLPILVFAFLMKLTQGKTITSVIIVMASGALCFHFVSNGLQRAAVIFWKFSDFGYSYTDAQDSFNAICAVEERGEDSSHLEYDYHAGEYLCGRRARTLQAMYPRPIWLFGDPPDYGL
jgi:hypothetical protein